MAKKVSLDRMLETLLEHEDDLSASDRKWVRQIDETAAKADACELSPRQTEVIENIYRSYTSGAAKPSSGAAKKEAPAKKGTGKRKHVTIYTDGSSRGNPGPGGYGTVLIFGKHRKEMSQGFRSTTNNRMEMMAAIAGLEALFETCEVTLHTDSQYLAKGFNQRWVEGWKQRGWKTSGKQPVKNKDLWKRLDALNAKHEIHWKWVKGHAGNRENERCDELATSAAEGKNLIDDEGFVDRSKDLFST